MVFAQYILHNLAQVHPFPVASEAVDHAAERTNAWVDLFPLTSLWVSTDQNVGEGLAVVTVIVVEQELRLFCQSVCFELDILTGVKGMLQCRYIMTKEN